jgi:hypothetical protein
MSKGFNPLQCINCKEDFRTRRLPKLVRPEYAEPAYFCQRHYKPALEMAIYNQLVKRIGPKEFARRRIDKINREHDAELQKELAAIDAAAKIRHKELFDKEWEKTQKVVAQRERQEKMDKQRAEDRARREEERAERNREKQERDDEKHRKLEEQEAEEHAEKEKSQE